MLWGWNVKATEWNVFFLKRLSLVSFLVNEANKKKYWMCSTWSNLSSAVLNAFIWLFPFQFREENKDTAIKWQHHSTFQQGNGLDLIISQHFHMRFKQNMPFLQCLSTLNILFFSFSIKINDGKGLNKCSGSRESLICALSSPFSPSTFKDSSETWGRNFSYDLGGFKNNSFSSSSEAVQSWIGVLGEQSLSVLGFLQHHRETSKRKW